MRNAKLKASALAGAFALAVPGAAVAQTDAADAGDLAQQGEAAIERAQQGDVGRVIDELFQQGGALLQDAGEVLEGAVAEQTEQTAQDAADDAVGAAQNQLDTGDDEPPAAEDTPSRGDGLSTGEDELNVDDDAPDIANGGSLSTGDGELGVSGDELGTGQSDDQGALGDTDVDPGASEANVFDEIWTEVRETFEGLTRGENPTG